MSSIWRRRRWLRMLARSWVALLSYLGRGFITTLLFLWGWQCDRISLPRSWAHSLQFRFPHVRRFIAPTACAPLRWRCASRCPFQTAVSTTTDAWWSCTYCSSTLSRDSRKYGWHHCRPNFLGEDHGNSFD